MIFTKIMFECNSNNETQIYINKGIQHDLMGIVDDVIHDTSTKTLYVKIQFNNGMVQCMYKYKEFYPIMKNDKIIMCGENVIGNFRGEEIQIFDVHSMTARYDFDLSTFINDNLLDNIDSESIKNLSMNIAAYSENYYGPGVDGILDCLNTMVEKIKDDKEIIPFANYIFGLDQKFNIIKTKELLNKYKDDVIKRPLHLLGMNEEEIDGFVTDLSEVYKIAKTNPFRLPEITNDRANYIAKKHLRINEIPEEWEKCGDISRYVYDSLKKAKWTSVPVSKMRSAFPYSFDKYKDIVLKDYYCKEDMEQFYFNPILKIEKVVSKVISKLITTEKENKYTPFYAGIEPSEEQDLAINGALNNRISIITGGAGTGKTEIIGNICETLIKYKSVPLCIAFTGVAAQRIKQSLQKLGIAEKCNVMTIHSAISKMEEITEEVLTHVIFDEFSMVDLKLFYDFMNTYSLVYNLSFIFVGDINQLEPIGYGNVMDQFLKTAIPIYRLTKNFRSEVGIISLISDVVDPKRFEDQSGISWSRDCTDYNFHRGNLRTVVDYIQFQYNAYKGSSDEEFLNYRDKITIVCPYKKTVKEINIEFQQIFMELYESVIIDGTKYHLHDRVMKLINNHNIEVMNGETGVIIEINSEFVVVKFRSKGQMVICPFLGRNFLKSVKKIHKDLKYSPHTINDKGIKIPKDKQVISSELKDLKEKTHYSSIKGITEHDLNNYFIIAEKYPFEIFSMSYHTEFLSLTSITLAYAITTHKSQGDQYPVCLYFVPSQVSNFVTYRNVYTGLSRAKEQLVVIAENETILNSCILTRGSFKYENLSARINNLLPDEFKVEQKPVEIVDDNFGDEIEYLDDELDW